MKNLSLYIHVPFCVLKCAYCDFYSLPCGKNGKTTEKAAYLNAVLRNIENWKKYRKDRKVNTIFIGGGTPTVLDTESLCVLISAIKKAFDISPNAEFTIEANPKTFDKEKLTALRSLGVNRLSIGVQSGNDNELKLLSRIHTAEEAKESFALARKCGFDNISLDLMYGIPSQTAESFERTLDFAVSLKPEHISVYGLQLEEGTPLWKKRSELDLPTEDEELEMNELLLRKLRGAGYERYEISNYSLPSRECKHNLEYWTQGEYLGFGPGAYSYYDGRRYYLPRELDSYCKCEEFDALSITDEMQNKGDSDREFIMLALRLTRGVELSSLDERTPNAETLLKRAKSFIQNGFMQIKGDRLSFTDKGFNVSNYVLSEILF